MGMTGPHSIAKAIAATNAAAAPPGARRRTDKAHLLPLALGASTQGDRAKRTQVAALRGRDFISSPVSGSTSLPLWSCRPASGESASSCPAYGRRSQNRPADRRVRPWRLRQSWACQPACWRQSPDVPAPAPSLAGAVVSGTIGSSRRIGIRALRSSLEGAALGVVASFCVIVGFGRAS